MPKCYLSGPMRGIKDYNFPLFDAAKAHMQEIGWDVISPADMDRESGMPQCDLDSPQAAREFAARDLDALLSLRAENGDAIVMLDGWEKSRGAKAEFFVANWLGLRLVRYRGDEDWSFWMSKHDASGEDIVSSVFDSE